MRSLVFAISRDQSASSANQYSFSNGVGVWVRFSGKRKNQFRNAAGRRTDWVFTDCSLYRLHRLQSLLKDCTDRHTDTKHGMMNFINFERWWPKFQIYMCLFFKPLWNYLFAISTVLDFSALVSQCHTILGTGNGKIHSSRRWVQGFVNSSAVSFSKPKTL